MHLELFSAGKPKNDPSLNEDLSVILPGFGFAVIDGLSDRTGHRYDGLSAGQMAARLVAGEVAGWLTQQRQNAPSELVRRVTERIAKAYGEVGITEVAMAEPGRRFGATLALAIDLGAHWRFVLVGDSGIRLNGSTVLQNPHPVDSITSALRIETYRLVTERGADAEIAGAVARAITFSGAATLPSEVTEWLQESDLPALKSNAQARARSALPDVPDSDIDVLLTYGIIRGQGRFQNNTHSPLSYAVFDGTAVPMDHVKVVERPTADLTTIELFTDGYMQPPAGTQLNDWEASFARIEALDPTKTAEFPCPKGSDDERWFDDRTVLIVRLDGS